MLVLKSWLLPMKLSISSMKKPFFYKKNSKLTNIFCGITIGKEAKYRKNIFHGRISF